MLDGLAIEVRTLPVSQLLRRGVRSVQVSNPTGRDGNNVPLRCDSHLAQSTTRERSRTLLLASISSKRPQATQPQPPGMRTPVPAFATEIESAEEFAPYPKSAS